MIKPNQLESLPAYFERGLLTEIRRKAIPREEYPADVCPNCQKHMVFIGRTDWGVKLYNCPHCE